MEKKAFSVFFFNNISYLSFSQPQHPTMPSPHPHPHPHPHNKFFTTPQNMVIRSASLTYNVFFFFFFFFLRKNDIIFTVCIQIDRPE